MSSHSPRNYRLLFLIVPAFTITGCLGPHKVDKWVARHYQEQPAPAFSKPINGIRLSSPLSTTDAALSATTKKTKVLPFLLFWKWDVDNHCTLNPGIPLGFFAAGLSAEARSSGLKEKLAGKTIEVSVEKIPRLINVNDNGWFAFILVYYVGGESISVGPEDGELAVSWRIVEKGVAGNWEHFNQTQEARPLYVKYFQSSRRTSGKSLKAYDERMAGMGRRLADEIVGRLDQSKTAAN